MSKVPPSSSGRINSNRRALCEDHRRIRCRPISHTGPSSMSTESSCASYTHAAQGSSYLNKITNKRSPRQPDPLDASGKNVTLRSVVQLETLHSKYYTLSHLQAFKDTEENGAIHQHTLNLRDNTGTSQETRIIKRPYAGSCEIKCTLAATDRWAIDIPLKQGRIQATAVKRNQASRKLDKRIKQYPVVSLCNITKIFKIPADLLNGRFILSLELQRKSIHCFNTSCSDQLCVLLPGPCMNTVISQDQQVYPNSSASSSDITCCSSVMNLVGPCDTGFKHSKTGINDYDKYIKRGMSLSNEKNTLFAQVSRSLKELDITMQVGSSTCVSSRCKLEPLTGPRVPSFPIDTCDTQLSNPFSCGPKKRVQKNSCTLANNVVTIEAEQNKLSVEQGREICPDVERETDRENVESFSCQRTTPYAAHVVCSRTCITWPFQKLGSSQMNSVKWNVHKPVSGLSMYKKCEGDAAADSVTEFKAFDASKGGNATITHNTAGDISVGNQHPTFLVSSTSVNISDKGNQETSTTALKGNSQLWLTKSMQKQMPFLESFEKNHLVGGVSETCKLPDVSENAFAFSGLSQCRSSTYVKPKWKSEQFSFPQVRKVSADHTSCSDDHDDNTSNLSSEESLVDDVCLPCSVIMCEITDTPTNSPKESSDPAFNSTEDGVSGGKVDLITAYEQDALVLDVIQDDPELFGNIPEETTEIKNKKFHQPYFTERRGSKDRPVLRTNHRIIWDEKESFTEHTDLGLPDQKYKAQGSISTARKDNDDEDPSSCIDRPSNGMVGDEFDIKYDLTQKCKADRNLNGAFEWLWPNFVTSDPRESKINSEYLSQSVNSSEWCVNNDFRCNALEEMVNSREQQVAARGLGSFGNPVDRKAYCKYYFSIYHTCFREACWYLHVPADGDEKFCMEAVQNFIRSMTCSHLERGVAVFVAYYQKCPPGIHFSLEELKFLLSALFHRGFVKDILSVLRVSTLHRILPPPEFILSLFDYMQQCDFHIATADLINVVSLCADAGLTFTADQFVHMQNCLEFLKVPRQQINVFRVVKHRALKSSVCNMKADLPLMFTEVMRCKEQEDWAALGQVFHNLCLSNCSLPELQDLCSIVVEALLKKQTTALLPFSPFTHAVCQGSTSNGLIKNLVGRIGVSLMFEYYKSQQWNKGRMLLNVLNKLKVSYSTLKALFASEETASRCQIVNMAVEVFLNTGSVEGAFKILKDDNWTISSSLWPCDAGDVQNRQAILFQLADSAALRGMHREVLEVLTNLPGLQHPTDSVHVSQYSKIFNQHLKYCIEKNLTVAFSTVHFMMMKNISVHKILLRTLIHKLGKQNIWRKARLLYKYAMSLGCYPMVQVNQYCKLLPIPHSMTEIEMTIAIEVFMVTNASDIFDQTQLSQVLQIVLKRKADQGLISEKDYYAARSRLLSAGQIANPKLVIKYATVNLSQEHVFTLEPLSASKWLNQNSKWTAKIWEQSSLNPSTSNSSSC